MLLPLQVWPQCLCHVYKAHRMTLQNCADISGHASRRSLSDHLVKKEVYKQYSFLVKEQVLCVCVGFDCSVCHHFHTSSGEGTPVAGSSLLCWLKPQKDFSVEARRQNLCMDQMCSELFDTGHTLVYFLTWKQCTGLAIIPGLTNLHLLHITDNDFQLCSLLVTNFLVHIPVIELVAGGLLSH